MNGGSVPTWKLMLVFVVLSVAAFVLVMTAGAL